MVGRRSFPVGFRPIFRGKLWLVSGSLRTAIDWFFNYIPVNISGWGDIFPFPSRKCIHLYPRCSMYDTTYIYHKNPPFMSVNIYIYTHQSHGCYGIYTFTWKIGWETIPTYFSANDIFWLFPGFVSLIFQTSGMLG